MHHDHLSRRTLLAGAVGAVGLTAVNAAGALRVPQPADTPVIGAGRARVLRVAHLTDSHVQPERAAGDGLAACLRHAQATPGGIDLILTGGDNVMDVMGNTAARGEEQLRIWQRVLRDECTTHIEHCIGNHDVWGWNKEKSATTGQEDLWGKKWALEAYGLRERYRSFDRAGWRFIILDSTFPRGDSYTARLDDEQFEWLGSILAQTPAAMPVLVLSHIPIISASVMFDGDNEESGDWRIPGAWMHIDARRIKDLFRKHSNIKVCLSGHLHLVDRVDYLGVTYICDGAVSGGWWKGPCQEFEPGYGLVDLYSDGSFEHRYVTYGWQAVDE